MYATSIRVVIINLRCAEFTVWKRNIFTVYSSRLHNRKQKINEYVQYIYIYINVLGK
jgi:hypothetical protein